MTITGHSRHSRTAIQLLLISWLACLPLKDALAEAATLEGALNTSTTEQGELFISLASEQHEISDLVRGRNQIADETGRSRSSISHGLAFSYGLSDRWALSGLISYVEHKRNVGVSFFGTQKTSGLGDSIIMLRYTPL